MGLTGPKGLIGATGGTGARGQKGTTGPTGPTGMPGQLRILDSRALHGDEHLSLSTSIPIRYRTNCIHPYSAQFAQMLNYRELVSIFTA